MSNIEEFNVLNLLYLSPSESYIDVESPRPIRGRIKTPPRIMVLNSDAPPTLRFSYYILGKLDAS